MTAFARVPKEVILRAIAARKEDNAALREKVEKLNKEEWSAWQARRDERDREKAAVVSRMRRERTLFGKLKYPPGMDDNRVWSKSEEASRDYQIFRLDLPITLPKPDDSVYLALETLCNATADDTVLLSPESVTLLKL